MSAHVRIYTYGSQRPERPPVLCNYYIDCRQLSNPFGKLHEADAIQAYVLGCKLTPRLLGTSISGILEHLVPGRTADMHIGCYCLFGRHRSPVIAQVLAQWLSALHYTVEVTNL